MSILYNIAIHVSLCFLVVHVQSLVTAKDSVSQLVGQSVNWLVSTSAGCSVSLYMYM